MWMLSFACLVFVGVMCIVGTLSKGYDDNIVQRIGMFLLCLGVAARANDVLRAGWVSDEALIAHIGMATFALGTTFKVWLRQAEPRVQKLFRPKLNESHLKRVSGGKK